MNWDPLILSFKLAVVTTVVLLFISIPMAYWLNYGKSRLKPIFEAIVSLPLVLPPTVLGFYLLILFSPSSGIGKWITETLGLKLVFSFEGLVIGSVIYSLPFMVHPIQSGFANLSSSVKDTAEILGKGFFSILWKVLLPNIKPSVLTGIILAFAHTLGEFGVVLMIGGNIDGETKVASIAIYEEVELLNYDQANQYSLILIGFTFIVLLFLYALRGSNFSFFKQG